MADAGPALASELIGYCHERLSKIKCPRSVDFEAELPRHATGKLYKRLLKDRYWARRLEDHPGVAWVLPNSGPPMGQTTRPAQRPSGV